MGFFGPPNIERLKRKRDVKGLKKLLHDHYLHPELPWEVVHEAKLALAQLGESIGFSGLASTLLDTNTSVERRCAAAAALGDLGEQGLADRDGVRALLEASYYASYDADPDVRSAARLALGRMAHQPQALEQLLAWLGESGSGTGDKYADHRSAAAQALGELGDTRCVGALTAALTDRSSIVREAAAEALGALGDPQAVDSLVASLDEIGEAAARALGRLCDSACEPLIAALGAENRFTRAAAALALGEIGDSRAAEPLLKALDAEEWDDVRRAAAEAVRKLGTDSLSVRQALREEMRRARYGAWEARRWTIIQSELPHLGLRDKVKWDYVPDEFKPLMPQEGGYSSRDSDDWDRHNEAWEAWVDERTEAEAARLASARHELEEGWRAQEDAWRKEDQEWLERHEGTSGVGHPARASVVRCPSCGTDLLQRDLGPSGLCAYCAAELPGDPAQQQ
jgi:HEAT repeat protein